MTLPKRNSFTFYRNFLESAKVLNDKQKLQLYDMIISKSLDNCTLNTDEKDPLVVAMFNLVKPTLSKSYEGWKHGSKRVPSKGAPKAPPRLDKDKDKDKDIKETIYSFEQFWNDYDKKRGIKKAIERYSKINEEDRQRIKNHVPIYVGANEKQYRKDPAAYLNQHAWLDEIIINDTFKENGSSNQQGQFSDDFSKYQL